MCLFWSRIFLFHFNFRESLLSLSSNSVCLHNTTTSIIETNFQTVQNNFPFYPLFLTLRDLQKSTEPTTNGYRWWELTSEAIADRLDNWETLATNKFDFSQKSDLRARDILKLFSCSAEVLWGSYEKIAVAKKRAVSVSGLFSAGVILSNFTVFENCEIFQLKEQFRMKFHLEPKINKMFLFESRISPIPIYDLE